MQLPLSASALVMLGVGAVLIGALVLVVELMRRRKPASGPARIPPDMRMQPAATSGRYAATPPADDPVAKPQIPDPPAVSAQTSVDPTSVPLEHAPEPAAPSPLAGPATPRPMEISSRVDPPAGGEQVPPDRTSPHRHQAGSGRTVAAAVAQAFAVRAAAARADVSGPDVQPPADPPPSDDSADDSAIAAPEQPDPVPDSVDPAAATEPDDLGPAAPAEHRPENERDAPEASASGDGPVVAAASAAFGSNGDNNPDRNGRPPEGWRPPEPGPGGGEPAAAAGAGLPASGLAMPAAPPRPDDVNVAQRRDGPASAARDRLLAVLLDDPERAVGAAVELDTCLHELNRLSDAVRTGRAALRDVLHRLAAAGLRPDQLARLARLPQAEVQELLEAEPAEQQV